MTRFPKSKVWLCFCMLMAFCSCINREFDSNEEYSKSSSIPLIADNDRLLSRIFIINESNSYLWFDINNEVANFSKPELRLPMMEGSQKQLSLYSTAWIALRIQCCQGRTDLQRHSRTVHSDERRASFRDL